MNAPTSRNALRAAYALSDISTLVHAALANEDENTLLILATILEAANERANEAIYQNVETAA